MATLENYVHFVHPKIHISCSHGYQLVGKEENAALRRISDPTNKFKKCGCGAQTSPALSPVPVLDLAENYSTAEQEDETGSDGVNTNAFIFTNQNQAIPCIDQLLEELTCAICWDICFEPTTTSCGLNKID
ncbi:RING-type domain-containing protein [Forsythia ovata]|uniref:RING-type domain-containing protein n=1 Tax=Forsythia ovata TaxID=205694 RepID=A0ABD1UE63_9LAMI